jgi:hypothetical protein
MRLNRKKQKVRFSKNYRKALVDDDEDDDAITENNFLFHHLLLQGNI